VHAELLACARRIGAAERRIDELVTRSPGGGA